MQNNKSLGNYPVSSGTIALVYKKGHCLPPPVLLAIIFHSIQNCSSSYSDI